MGEDVSRRVPTRRVTFEQRLAALDRRFAGPVDPSDPAGDDSARIAWSHVWAALSATFPNGEDYFVRSVRHHRDRIADPALQRDVAGFIGQEATHSRQHRALNERLAELGYPTAFIDRWTAQEMAFDTKVLSPMVNLAYTAALEHVTATLAELLLSDERARAALGTSVVRDVFLWHALEELEHKAVAFDVYRAVGGTERMRITTMRVLRWYGLAGLVLGLPIALWRDDGVHGWRGLRACGRALRRSPLVGRTTWDLLRAFERRDFHPDDRDTSALVAAWRERLFGPEGDLTEVLVAS